MFHVGVQSLDHTWSNIKGGGRGRRTEWCPQSPGKTPYMRFPTAPPLLIFAGKGGSGEYTGATQGPTPDSTTMLCPIC